MAGTTNRKLLADYLLKQSTFGKNYILNPSGFDNTVNVTVSGASVSRNITTPLTTISDLQVDYTAAAQYAEWSMETLDRSIAGRNCEIRADYKLSLGSGATVLAQIYQGGTLIASTTLQNTTSSLPLSFNAPCGQASTTFRVTQSVGAVTSTLNIANIVYGIATNISNQGLTTDWVTYTPTFSASFGTVTGINFKSRRNGSKLEVQGYFTSGTTTAAASTVSIGFNGVDQSVTADSNVIPTAVSGQLAQVGFFTQTSQADTNTVLIEGGTSLFKFGSNQSGLGSTPVNANGILGNNKIGWINASIPITGWAAQNAVTIDQTNYDWTAYTPTFQGMGTTSNIDVQAKRSGSDLLIRGKYMTGTVTAVEARIGLPTGLTSAGTSKIGSIQLCGTWTMDANQASYMTMLIEPSVTYLTMGVQNAGQNGLNKQNANTIINPNAFVTFNVRVPIAGWLENQNAPILIGSVTSASAGAERIERARVSGACTSTPCTLANSSGGISSISRSSGGNYAINFTSGMFTAVPTCSGLTQSVGSLKIMIIDPTRSGTAASVPFQTYTLAGTPTDDGFDIICTGPRS